MDSKTTTDDIKCSFCMSDENKNYHGHLLEMIKELCSDNNMLSSNVRGKVSRILADRHLVHYECSGTLLRFMHQTSTELTYEEQVELDEALNKKIENEIPSLTEKTKILEVKSQMQHLRTLQKTVLETKKSIACMMNAIKEMELKSKLIEDIIKIRNNNNNFFE